MTTKQKKFNYLKPKAHMLLEEIFPDRTRRYMWLEAHFEKIHFADMNKRETLDVIHCLESKRDGEFCLIHKKMHGKVKQRI